MSSDSESDYEPLPYSTPSPYKKRKIPTIIRNECAIDLKEKDMLLKRVEEIKELENVYCKRIVENMNKNILDKKGNKQKLVCEYILNASGSAEKPCTPVKDILPNISFTYPYKYYFCPNNYFNKFKQDISHLSFISEKSLFRQLTAFEILELIKAEALVLPDDYEEKVNIINFLCHLGTVSEDELIVGRVSTLLSDHPLSFSNFIEIVENLGRVKEANTPSRTNEIKEGPQPHNLEFLIDKITISIKEYSLQELKEILSFLINVSLDPLCISLGHLLIQPLKLCIEEFYNKDFTIEEIVNLIDIGLWDLSCTIFIVMLLFKSNQYEIGILVGYKILYFTLIQSKDLPSNPINMDSLYDLLKMAETQLISLDLNSSLMALFLFELMAYRVPGREKFDVWKIIKLLEKIKHSFHSQMRTLYFTEIINRMKLTWGLII